MYQLDAERGRIIELSARRGRWGCFPPNEMRDDSNNGDDEDQVNRARGDFKGEDA